MEPEYAVKISLTQHKHDNPLKPFYWSLIRYEEVWHQIAFGWEESSQACFQAAIECYNQLTSFPDSIQKS